MKSQAQRAYLWIHEPKVAAEFESKTPDGAKLPHRVKDKVRKLVRKGKK